MEHDEEVDNHGTRHGTPLVKPKTNAPAVRGRGRPKKDRTQAEKEENMDIKHFKMWPFRYFGCVLSTTHFRNLINISV